MAHPLGPIPPTERLAFRLDRATRTVIFEAFGPIRAETYGRAAVLLARRHLEARDYARIYDVRGYTGTIRHEELVRLNRLLAEQAGVMPREIVVISDDPGFPLWARALEATLYTRPRIVVVATLAAARDAVERLRADARASPG